MEVTTPQPDEFQIIFDSWANSYRKSPYAGTVPNHLWDQVSRATMHGIMERGGLALVLVTPIEGREAEYPGVRRVMGYSISEPQHHILHWLYIKKDFRGFGNGRRLLAVTCPDGEWDYTHKMPASAKFLGPRFHYEAKWARIKVLNEQGVR